MEGNDFNKKSELINFDILMNPNVVMNLDLHLEVRQSSSMPVSGVGTRTKNDSRTRKIKGCETVYLRKNQT